MDKIQELKEKYGDKARAIIENGLNLVRVSDKYRCPNTMAHKRQDKNPSMGWHGQANQFHCFTCGMKIDIYSYYREHCNYTHNEIMAEIEDVSILEGKRKSFKDQLKDLKILDNNCKKYVQLRGISEETILKHDLRAYKGRISFLYKKYDNVVGVKTRQPQKVVEGVKMKSITGSKFNLYNFNNLNDSKSEIVICEGEFDCMILDECGVDNAVSVPTGASSLNLLFEQEGEFLNTYETIIIASDNDEAGSRMDELFVDKFGDKVKLIDKKIMDSINDINELFLRKGKPKVTELINSARFKIAGRRDIDDTPYSGLEDRAGKYISTGMNQIDYALNDLAPRCVTVVVGRTNAGKTTFVRQVVANAIDTDNKVFCVLGEGDDEIFLNELYTSIIGKDEKYYTYKKINKRKYKEPRQEVLGALRKWHEKKLVLFNKGESELKTMDQLFEILKYEIKFKGHNLIVLDNLMSLLTINNSSEKNDAQGEFVQKCCNLAKAYNTHIIIVVHPHKDAKNKNRIDIENISGSMDIGNKADNIVGVERIYHEEDEDETVQGIDGSIKILKNRYFKQLSKVSTVFDDATGMLLGLNKNAQAERYNFKWKKYFKDEEKLHLEYAEKLFA